MKYRKVLTFREFEARCIVKNVTDPKKIKSLWNRYIDREWDALEEELQIPLDKQLK